MDTFYNSLEKVLNINSEQAAALIEQFNTGDSAFFETYFKALPTVKLETGNTKNISANETLFVEEDSIGEGAFGTVLKNKSRPYVYKKILDEKGLGYFQNNIKEAIIQTLLQSDANYGKHVCRLYKVYRDGYNLVFQIEPLEITLDKYIRVNKLDDNVYQTTLPKVMLKMIEILNYFKWHYGFIHNDLSTGNIMTVKTGDIVENLKLIDFGMSQIKIGNIEIGKQKKLINDAGDLWKRIKYDMDSRYRSPFDKILRLPVETPIQVLTNIFIFKKSAGGRKTRKNRSISVK